MTAEDLVFVLAFCCGVLTALLPVAYFVGRDEERCCQARRDQRMAAKMRAAIRDLDERTATFAPLSAIAAQSTPERVMAGARSTALVSLPPASRKCPTVPEDCLCPECVADGVPPSP